MLPSIKGMLGDVFDPHELSQRGGGGGVQILEVQLPTVGDGSAPPEIADVTLEASRITFTRPNGDPELSAVLGADSEGPLLPRFYPQNPITLTPAIIGFATLGLIGIAELNHRSGDTRNRDYIDEIAARNIDALDDISTVEFNGMSNKWQELVRQRAALLRSMRAEMLVEWGTVP